MKKFLMILSAAALLFTACNNKPTPPTPTPEPEVTFTLNVTQHGDGACYAQVEAIPSSDTAVYYFAVLPQASYANYESDSALMQEAVDYYIEMAEYYNVGEAEMIEAGILSKGKDAYYFDLLASTKYYAYAFAIDWDKETFKGSLTKVAFETAPIVNVNLNFEVTTNDTAIFFTPMKSDIYYLPLVENADTLAAAGVTAQVYYEDYIAQIKQYAAYGISIDDFTQMGNIYIPFSQMNAGSYVFMARAYNGGQFNSQIFTYNFTVGGASAAPARIADDKATKMLNVRKADFTAKKQPKMEKRGARK